LSSDVDHEYHGLNHALDEIGSNMGDNPSGFPFGWNTGWPDFRGWPNIREIDHQKVYQDWLHRAVQGGLRLMVMMAVDNPVVCASVATDGRDCTDQVTTIQKQLAAAYAMQDYIDADGGGNGAGWYRIVTTPAEARAVVARGQLAVVLGVETANPPLWGDVRPGDDHPKTTSGGLRYAGLYRRGWWR
jgi:hypothetical protein